MQRNGQLSVTVRTGRGPLFRVSVPCEGGAHETWPGAALQENGHGTCTGALGPAGVAVEVAAEQCDPVQTEDPTWSIRVSWDTSVL